jgi:DNA mismatch endonuclease (patch repair protein)
VKAQRLPPFRRPPAVRSQTMRAIRSTSNKSTERRLASLLAKNGLRGWRLRTKELPGTPDFVFAREGVAVFSDGCFFHGCPYCGHIPKTNTAYWRAKIARNRRRDAKVDRELRTLGYSIVRVWECQLRDRPASCLKRIQRALKSARNTADSGNKRQFLRRNS